MWSDRKWHCRLVDDNREATGKEYKDRFIGIDHVPFPNKLGGGFMSVHFIIRFVFILSGFITYIYSYLCILIYFIY